MRDLEDLKRELETYERELSSLYIVDIKDYVYDPGNVDSKVDKIRIESYSNPDRAEYLKKQIDKLKSQIGSYAKDAEASRISKKFKEAADKKWREDRVKSESKKIYDESIESYMQESLWGKAGKLFSGKKPKKLNQQQIIDTYGQEAVQQIEGPLIDEILHQKEEQLKKVNEMFAGNQKELEIAIRQTEMYFDQRLATLQSNYDKALSNVSGGKIR